MSGRHCVPLSGYAEGTAILIKLKLTDALTLERLIRKDRWIVAAALLLVSILAWAWVLLGAGMGMDAFECLDKNNIAR